MYEALKLSARMHLPSEKNIEKMTARLNTARSWHWVQHLYLNFFHCLCSAIYLTSVQHMRLNGYSRSRVWRISFKPWFNCEIIQSLCPIWRFKQMITGYLFTSKVRLRLSQRKQRLPHAKSKAASRKAAPWQRVRLYRLTQCVFNARHLNYQQEANAVETWS